MDRRQFLRSIGAGMAGGVVASATGADVGLWADMMAWLKGPKRAYSFPADPALYENGQLTLSHINAVITRHMSETLTDLWGTVEYGDSWFKDRYLIGRGMAMMPFTYPRSDDKVKL